MLWQRYPALCMFELMSRIPLLSLLEGIQTINSIQKSRKTTIF